MSARIVAVFAYRYEPDDLVEELRANIGWADALCEWNTREDPRTWIPREERVRHLTRQAHRARADWVLYMDVDERIEDGAEEILRRIADGWKIGLPTNYKFRLAELFTPTERRVDGVWGRKTRRRFFHLHSHLNGTSQRHHVLLETPMLAHLKHIDPTNEAIRAAVFNDHNTWDRGGRDGTGFDYLADREGMVLEPVGRSFTPAPRAFEFRVPGYGA